MRAIFLFFATLGLLLLPTMSPVWAQADNPLLAPCEVTEDGDATCETSFDATSTAEAAALQTQADKIPFILFHLDTCPHCQDEIAFIKYVVKYTNCFWRYK